MTFNKMRIILFGVMTTVLSCFSSCSEKCSYQEPIEDILINDWDSNTIPLHGKVYSFKKGTNFRELIDSFEVSIIERNPAQPNCLVCSLGDKKPTHENDIRLILDDMLLYDISNITLSWFVDNRHWTMGGPMEYCIVSSLSVNGHVSRKTIFSGRLLFSQKYVRRLKKLR